VSLRLFDPHRCAFDLSHLHVPESLQVLLKNTMCHWRFGLILISGSTGSGKTATLYALGQLLRQQNRKLVALEDPVEIETDQWVQINVNDAIGYTFDLAFRGVIQHDVEVLLIGEIRDRETARVAFEASLAGYLVITTIHADSLDLVPFRCQELGIDVGEFLNTIRLQIHQTWDKRTASPHPHFTWKVHPMNESAAACN
jgi:type II secretory ATPase GspE/PulE/Tfp pilus assembly ATPase PilB-like protein